MSFTITSELENYAHGVKEKYGVPESVTLGQAIYESSLGQSNIAKQANNWFGMKGTGTAGSYNGWQKFNNVSESFDAYGKLLSKDRYTSHTKNATTTAEYLQGIVNGGYCSDAGYVSNVLKIIHDNNLEQYNTSQYKGSSSLLDSAGSVMSGIGSAVTDTAKNIGAKILTAGFIILAIILGILCIAKAFEGVD